VEWRRRWSVERAPALGVDRKEKKGRDKAEEEALLIDLVYVIILVQSVVFSHFSLCLLIFSISCFPGD
jgi:hypothetical protein